MSAESWNSLIREAVSVARLWHRKHSGIIERVLVAMQRSVIVM
jgi:hypothetical protein